MMHRRKSSKSDDDEPGMKTHIANGHGEPRENGHVKHAPHLNGDSHPARHRVVSTPSTPRLGVSVSSPLNPNPPPSAGAFRTGFNIPPSPSYTTSRTGSFPPPSPFRTSFQTPPSPIIAHSPGPAARSHRRSNSSISTFPTPISSTPTQPLSNGPTSPPPTSSNRRHSRIHSRNLSIFFPRPGNGAPAAISEDGAQEIEIDVPVTDIPSAGTQTYSDVRAGLNNFTFGRTRAPENGQHSPESGDRTSKRRGHHHKHSLSHNFFSFMEPQSISMATPTPTTAAFSPIFHVRSPSSAWDPNTAFPQSATSPTFNQNGLVMPSSARSKSASPLGYNFPGSPTVQSGISSLTSRPAELFSALQFLVGAFTWVEGQRKSSLACTGLGYWVVFDAIGVVVGQIRSLATEGETLRRPFGARRVETTALFAQTIYLIFASVYVLKEAVEHMLLSLGSPDSSDDHHHHHGTHGSGIEFPVVLLWLSFLSLIASCALFNNHARLVNVSGTELPAIQNLLHPFRTKSNPVYSRSPSLLSRLLSNPFTLAPLAFTSMLLFTSYFVVPAQHTPIDLFLAAVETVLTFSTAYPAAVALGAILLQTAPAAGFQLSSFQRAMRELERHPDVLEVPPPHLWQLSASKATLAQPTSASSDAASGELVATVEIHVRDDLNDDEVLELTRWAWEKCMGAIGKGGGGQVAVSVVRG